MLFYFAWIHETETFNPEVHMRQDEDIFNLVITEQEGLFPTATVSVRQLSRTDKGPFAFISCALQDKVHLLFKGRLIRVPIALEGELLTLELIAEPSEADNKLKELAQEMQKFPYYDPLFLAPERRLEPDIHELLDARDDLLFWSRTTQDVKLSHIFQGRYTVDLGNHFFYDSLDVRLTDVPLTQVDVELKMQWRQRYRGEAFLDHLLQAALPEGMLSTLTGADLEARWWENGDTIGRSGYRLSHSELKKVDRTRRGKSKTSHPFWISPHDPLSKRRHTTLPQKIRLQKNWYRPHLRVHWRYCQKRVEKLFLTLKNDVQSLGYHPHHKRILRLNLHDMVAAEQCIEWHSHRLHWRGEKVVQAGRSYLCLRTHRASEIFTDDLVNWQDLGVYQESCLAEARGTFFASDRGVQAVEHALEIARAHLAASTRAVEIKFSCDFKKALELTCDHSVILEDDRLPGKKMMGKVKKLVFEVIGQTGQATASISLACSLGTGQINPMPLEKKDSYAEEYFAPRVMNEEPYQRTLSGICYQSYDEQLPERGHVFPAFLGASDILRNVEVVNDAEAQEKHLSQHQYPHSHDLQKALRTVKTGVKLLFEDLRSVGVQEHHIHVHLPYPWSAPKQIDLV